MIDLFIKHSRASFNSSNNKAADLYYLQFEEFFNILSKIHPEIVIPEIKIVHSLNRLSETFIFNNKPYIIHDQYLGQSFNKMNRILYHEDEIEALAYLCKILGEEYYIINNISKSIAYTTFYKLNNKAKAIDLPDNIKKKKNILTSIQESFVFFHEFSHSIVSQDRNHLKHTKDFLLKNKGKHLVEIVKETIKEKKIPLNKIDFFFEEVACDFLAINFTYGIYKSNNTATTTEIFTGITSAFLYLRTIYDLRDKARNVEEDIFTFFTKIRYNTLRVYINATFSNSDYDPKSLLEVYELWEDKFDITADKLTDNFEKKLFQNIDNCDISIARQLIGINI